MFLFLASNAPKYPAQVTSSAGSLFGRVGLLGRGMNYGETGQGRYLSYTHSAG